MFVLIILYSEFHRNCVVQCQDKRKRIRPDRPSSHSGKTTGFCKASMCLIVLIIYVDGFNALNHFNCKMPDHLPCRPQELKKVRWLLLLCDWSRREALHCFDFRRSGNVTTVLQKKTQHVSIHNVLYVICACPMVHHNVTCAIFVSCRIKFLLICNVTIRIWMLMTVDTCTLNTFLSCHKVQKSAYMYCVYFQYMFYIFSILSCNCIIGHIFGLSIAVPLIMFFIFLISQVQSIPKDLI